MTIAIIDSNEQATNPRIVEKLYRYFPSLAVSHLTCGDANIITDAGKTVAIERKEPSDFLGSIGDGRVFRQVENMAQNSDYSAIIITGTLEFDLKTDAAIANGQLTNWHGKAVRAALCDIMWSACPVLWSNENNYGEVILEVVDFCKKPGVREHLKPRPVTFPPPDERVQILSGFPGVGFKRAKALLSFVGHRNKLGKLGEALVWASSMGAIKEDVRPDGWGTSTIENFREVLGLKEDERLAITEDLLSEGGMRTKKDKPPKK